MNLPPLAELNEQAQVLFSFAHFCVFLCFEGKGVGLTCGSFVGLLPFKFEITRSFTTNYSTEEFCFSFNCNKLSLQRKDTVQDKGCSRDGQIESPFDRAVIFDLYDLGEVLGWQDTINPFS